MEAIVAVENFVFGSFQIRIAALRLSSWFMFMFSFPRVCQECAALKKARSSSCHNMSSLTCSRNNRRHIIRADYKDMYIVKYQTVSVWKMATGIHSDGSWEVPCAALQMGAAFDDSHLYFEFKFRHAPSTLPLKTKWFLSLSLSVYIYLFIYPRLALEILLSAHIVFPMGLRTNNDYFAIEHQLIGLIIKSVCVYCAVWTEYFGL